MRNDRRGVAIVLVIMMILAGGALAHGALLAARSELAASRARADRVERQALERLSLERALVAGDVPGARAIGIWDVWEIPDAERGLEVVMRRTGPESWWASGAGSRRGSVGAPARLLWWMDPVARVEALRGVVTIGAEGPVTVAGDLEGLAWGAAPPPLTAAICEQESGRTFAPAAPSLLAVLDSGVVRPGLGLLGFDTLLARSPTSVEGAGTPAPVEAGAECRDEDPWNWGDPERPTRPCGAHLVVRAAPHGVRVIGGVGQGAWVVDGDLVLEDGARLYGLILTSGALVVETGAEFRGAVVAVGGLRIAAGAAVGGSACWAVRALGAAAEVWAPRPEAVPGVPVLTP